MTKNLAKHLAFSQTIRTFASLLGNKASGAVAQLNRAFDYGSEGLGFESLQRHRRMLLTSVAFFVLLQLSQITKTRQQ